MSTYHLKIILFAYSTLGTPNFGFMGRLQESLEYPKTVYTWLYVGEGGIFVGRECKNLVRFSKFCFIKKLRTTASSWVPKNPLVLEKGLGKRTEVSK